MAKVSILRVLMGLAAMVMLLEVATAADYTVGSQNGNGGWDLNTDLGTWASSQTFTVGDNLDFQFGSTHDVLEVTKANFDSCGTGSPISTTTNSPARFALSASGSRYFICGRGSHCSQGMKVQIDVVAATTPAPPQSPNTPTTPAPTTPSSPTPPSSDSPPPPVTGTTVNPPSSAISLKTTTGTVLGFGFLVIMLLSL